jgi:hypothetical protein
MLKQIIADHQQFSFVSGQAFRWSPSEQTIYYPQNDQVSWSLLHELGHALLSHQTYASDLELLKIELSAWDKAKQIGADYGVIIDQDHIEDCLDTYRDWLKQRATCPDCQTVTTQTSDNTYLCFSCNASWTVPSSPLCRTIRIKKTSLDT